MIQATLHTVSIPTRVVYVVENRDRKEFKILKFVDDGYEHLCGAVFYNFKTYRKGYGMVYDQKRPSKYWLCI